MRMTILDLTMIVAGRVIFHTGDVNFAIVLVPQASGVGVRVR